MSVTDEDREAARSALVNGWNDCEITQNWGKQHYQTCTCDIGSITGCKAKVEAIAKAIAATREAR